MAPAARPSRIAAQGSMNAQAGVIATSPATAPEAIPRVVGLPTRYRSTRIQPPAAAAVAIWVLMNARAAVPSAASSEPALKPNQPNHSQCATGKYTSVAQATVNTAQAPNLVRSAIAPLISATVMTANVSWKAEKMRSGMPFTRVALFTSPCSPRYARPPMNPLPFANDSESPYRTQAIVTVMMATHDIIIMFRTLLARVMPP